MNVRQGGDFELIFRLLDNTQTAVTGKIFSDVSAEFWKPGLTSLTARAILEEEFLEIGNGYYSLKLSGQNDLNTLGIYFLRLSGTGFETVEKELILEVPPVGIDPNPAVCTVSGSILDIGGEAGGGQQVTFRGVDFPIVSGASLITSDAVRTLPDAQGNFSVKLLRNRVVLIEVDRTGVRNQITIPDQETALVVDLLPPIP